MGETPPLFSPPQPANPSGSQPASASASQRPSLSGQPSPNAPSPRPANRAAVSLLVAAGVLWLLGAFAAFLAVPWLHWEFGWAFTHTPAWMLDLQGRWRGMPWDVAGQGALTLALGAVAMWLGSELWERWWGPSETDRSGRDVLSGAVWGGGLVLGLWGTAIFLLGLAGAWRWPRPIFGALFAGSAVAAAVLRTVRVRRRGQSFAGERAPTGSAVPTPTPSSAPSPSSSSGKPSLTLGLLHPNRGACLTRGEWLVAVPVVAVQVLAFLYAMTPAVQSDGLRYHLAAPQEWLKAGGPVYLAFNAFSNFPSTVEMLFLAGLGLAGDLLAKGFHFLFLPLTTLAVACLTRELMRGSRERDEAVSFPCPDDAPSGRMVAQAFQPANEGDAFQTAPGGQAGKPAPLWRVRPWVLAAAVWGTLPIAVPLGGWEYIDLALVFFTLGVVHFLLRYLRTGRSSDWVAAALFGGLLVASKYTGVLTVVFGAVILVLGGVWRRGWVGPLSAPFPRVGEDEPATQFVVPALAGPLSATGLPPSLSNYGPAEAGTTNGPAKAGTTSPAVGSTSARETFGRIVTRTVAFGLIAAAFGVPWWVKSAVLTHNPVYPLAYSLFHSGGEWTQTCADIYAEKLKEKGWRPVENGTVGSNYGLKAFLESPWNTAVHSEAFEGFEIGPFFWVLAPWILFYLARGAWWWRRRPGDASLALWMAFFVVSWFFTYQSNRFLMPALAVATAVAAAAVGSAVGALRGGARNVAQQSSAEVGAHKPSALNPSVTGSSAGRVFTAEGDCATSEDDGATTEGDCATSREAFPARDPRDDGVPRPWLAKALCLLCVVGVALPVAYGAAKSACWLLFDEGRIRRTSPTQGVSAVRWPAYTLGFMDRDAFLTERLPVYYPAARFASGTLAPGQKVLLVGEHRKFHWRCAVEGNDWYDAPRILPFLKGAQTADEALDAIAAAGFTHVYFNLDEWWGWPTEPAMLTAGAAVPRGSAWWYNRRHFDARELALLDMLLRSPRLEPVLVTVPASHDHPDGMPRVWLARLRPAGAGK